MSKKIRIHTDGGARGNPGPAGIGAVVEVLDENGGVVVKENVSKYIGETTNNQAEYQALIAALEVAKKLKGERVDCFLDSELIVKQLNHEYRVKDQFLAQLYMKVWNLSTNFKSISYTYIRREYNKEADKLVNVAIDKAVGKK